MKKQKKGKRKDPMWTRLLLAFVTLLNITLSIVLRVMNRQETLKIIKNEDEMRVIEVIKKETR